MGFKCGIVGLPNVGKSTLFNALTKTIQAQAENYPFCTIEPNSGIVAVPDKRLDKVAQLADSKKVIPASLEVVDIAGLVKGASKGEGLGNQFLENIRSIDTIIHVLRCFDDPDITHVEGSVDPIRDLQIIMDELIFSDMASLERRKENLKKKIKSGDKDAKALDEVIDQCNAYLENGDLESIRALDDIWKKELGLLTSKNCLYVCNVLEEDAATGNDFVKSVETYVGMKPLIVSANIEAEISTLESEEQYEYLQSLSLSESGLDQIIRAGYETLNLITYLTAGPKEARAWPIAKGTLAPQAASKIHTDFERGFIRAEVIAYSDYIEHQGESGAKNAGKMRSEGKEYEVQDGDIILFRFNV